MSSYSQYVDSVFECDPVNYFKELLISNGFNVSEVNSKTVLSKAEEKEQKQLIELNTERSFEQFLQDDITNSNEYMVENAITLGIETLDETILTEYKDVIADNNTLGHYFNFVKYCKNDKYINDRIEHLKHNTISSKVVTSSEHKIKLIHDLEKINCMKPFDVTAELETFKLDKELFDNIKFTFRNREDKPTTCYAFKKMYIALLKNLFSGLNIIESRRIRKNNGKDKIDIVTYAICDDNIKKYLELTSYNDSYYESFNDAILNEYNIIRAIKPDENVCLFSL